MTGKVPERSPLVAFSFEGPDRLEVVLQGKKCNYTDGRYIMEFEQFAGTSATIEVTNISRKTVEILRASMHFSWDGQFPELLKPTEQVKLGVAADL